LLSPEYQKPKITAALRLLTDEPDYESDLFGYKGYSEQLYSFLKESLPDKPFAICLAGDWGDGKTSLLQRVYRKLDVEERAGGTKIKGDKDQGHLVRCLAI
jgi:predicted ATPase